MPRLAPLAVVLALAPAATAADKPTPEQLEFFENKVRPVLAEHCYSCHGEKKQSAGLRLDKAAAVKQGADDGPVVVPGDPAKSRLVQSVKRENDFPMPPKAALPADAVAALTEWVKTGAAYPEDQAKAAAAPDPKNHWAFKPVARPPVPPPAGNNPIDAFVVAKLAEKGLGLSPPADKRTLIRRASFDLTGLPPTADEIAAFEADDSPEAFARVIDRLLASPAYGERWGRYWLDVARYADTKGYVFQEDRNYPFAYTYRDYVIKSFNEDKPFDQFVIEQLAADKLGEGGNNGALAAMGFLTLGRRFLNNQPDVIDDRIDVVTRGLMGLTVQCARCHDHKYDPVPTKDYYSLYGVFASSTEPKDLPPIGKVERTPEVAAFEAEVEKREAGYRAEVAKRHAGHVQKLRSAAGVSDYLRAYLEFRGKPAEQVRRQARERDLSQFVIGRWAALIDPKLKPHSPVFSPLVALAAVPEADLAAKAGDVLAKMAADPKTPAHPAVLAALRDAKPKTIRDVTDVYGKLLTGTGDGELAAALAPGGPTDVPEADFDKLQNRADRDQLAQMRQKIEKFKADSPFAPPRAMVLTDGERFDPYVFLRGNPDARGPAVPRQFLEVVAGPGRKPFADGSGRLELAKAIASPDNPLTARVFVNRVWIGHFGQGLVRTPSDFGLRSDPPTHPELLDWLAGEFADGWRVKRLHRLITLSATYQQASGATAEQVKADPENRLLSHQNRRRLDFEGLRDALLAASGKLDRKTGGKPVDLFRAPFTGRRTVYGFIDRQNVPGTFRSFDVASPDQHSPQRFQTTVPQQALFLMNSPFVTEQAAALAARPEVAAATSPDEKIAALYRITLGRGPTAAELSAGREFVAAAARDAAAEAEASSWPRRLAAAANPFGAWPQYAQVLLLSNEFAFTD
jgi:hypothetical protein